MYFSWTSLLCKNIRPADELEEKWTQNRAIPFRDACQDFCLQMSKMTTRKFILGKFRIRFYYSSFPASFPFWNKIPTVVSGHTSRQLARGKIFSRAKIRRRVDAFVLYLIARAAITDIYRVIWIKLISSNRNRLTSALVYTRNTVSSVSSILITAVFK